MLRLEIPLIYTMASALSLCGCTATGPGSSSIERTSICELAKREFAATERPHVRLIAGYAFLGSHGEILWGLECPSVIIRAITRELPDEDLRRIGGPSRPSKQGLVLEVSGTYVVPRCGPAVPDVYDDCRPILNVEKLWDVRTER